MFFFATVAKGSFSRTTDLGRDLDVGPVWVRKAWRLGSYCMMRPIDRRQNIRREAKLRDVSYMGDAMWL
ncbi:MAG: hypothetical protein ABJS66_11425 [Paracoccaceae bacterium]